MENTLENRAKFFALYWDQDVLNHECFDWIYPVGDDISLQGKGYWLELCPLSQITDEDAIEVAKILGSSIPSGDMEFRYTVMPKGFANRCPSIISVLQEWHCKHPLINEWVKMKLIQFDTEDNEISCDNYVNDGENLEEMVEYDVLYAYDLLRSKGYALPWMGLSVVQLVEYGWVKLKS